MNLINDREERLAEAKELRDKYRGGKKAIAVSQAIEKRDEMLRTYNAIVGNKVKQSLMRDIFKSMGRRNIDVKDLFDDESSKWLGVMNMVSEGKMNLMELGALNVFMNWAKTGDPKYGTFIRDTMGEKPVDKLDVTSRSTSVLDEFSSEDLQKILDLSNNLIEGSAVVEEDK